MFSGKWFPEMDGTVRGRGLRFLMLWHIYRRGETITVAELVELLVQDGVNFGDHRPSKLVSDALRWEVRRGRLVKVGRGAYAPGRMPRSTRWWIMRAATLMRSLLNRVKAENRTKTRLLPHRGAREQQWNEWWDWYLLIQRVATDGRLPPSFSAEGPSRGAAHTRTAS